MIREICFDTETTGLDPRDGHKIIEIACVEMIDRIKTGKVFHKYINPRREVPEEAFRIHGISTDFLQDKPLFDHIAQDFLDFIGNDILIAHNANFDLKFLNHELSIINLPIITIDRVEDTLSIARKKFPGTQNSLDALCKRFKIDLSRRTKHGALLDSELLCDVYVELMGGVQKGFVFEEEIKKTELENDSSTNVSAGYKNFPKRNFDLTAEEKQAHKEFILKNFKKNFWDYS